MGNRRVLILVIAVALAGLTAFLTFQYANSADERASKGAELVEAYMVKKDIPKGFSGDQAVAGGFIGKEKIPRNFFPAKGITSTEALKTEVAAANLSSGVPIVEGDFVTPGVGSESFTGRLKAGMQAVTLSVSDVEGVARLVVPGDHVNLMLTTDKQNGEKETQFVLQNVEVLAVGNTTALQTGQTGSGQATKLSAGQAPTVDSGLMTFAAAPLDAERLVNASLVGSIHLTLVPDGFTPAPVPPVNHGNLFS